MKWLAISLLCLAGCAGRETLDGSRQQLPMPFMLSLHIYSSSDKRAVFYSLEEDGMLKYAPGRHANSRQVLHEVGLLTDGERFAIWRIILDNDLLAARGQFLPKAHRVQYKLALRAGAKRQNLTAVDDNVPGLAVLDQYLFEIQRRRRYGTSAPSPP